MSINDRIAELIEELKENENSFSKRLGVSSSAIFNIVNPKGRRSYPSGVVLDKILSIEEEGSQVSAEWLMRGTGSIFMGNDEKDSEPNVYSKIEDLASKFSKLEEEFEQLKRRSS